jgi:hypothetical protein
MRARTSQLARLVLLAAVVALVGPSPARDASAPTPDDPRTAAGSVRLRKLHLVRPDLIPYPISFEVYA